MEKILPNYEGNLLGKEIKNLNNLFLLCFFVGFKGVVDAIYIQLKV